MEKCSEITIRLDLRQEIFLPIKSSSSFVSSAKYCTLRQSEHKMETFKLNAMVGSAILHNAHNGALVLQFSYN